MQGEIVLFALVSCAALSRKTHSSNSLVWIMIILKAKTLERWSEIEKDHHVAGKGGRACSVLKNMCSNT